MSKLLSIWKLIRKHKYAITIIGFIVIIGFLDDNSVVKRMKYQHEINALTAEINDYRAQYEESVEKLNELTANPEAIERIAREKYLMKKPNEDIFIFE